ncbi:MAG: 2-phosphosulfolactate phosphatase [Planctomycetota bacterium]
MPSTPTLSCEWADHGIDLAPANAVIIVVDVLSFTTSVDVGVGRGATVWPYRWKDETAAAYADSHDAILAQRRGVTGHTDQPGTGFSLSPASLLSLPMGTRLVLPSPNGSRLSFKAHDTHQTVIAGCFRNANAVGRYAASLGGPIAVIPAGERWPDGSLRPALEDWLGAGAVLAAILEANPSRTAHASPEAETAIASFRHHQAELISTLLACRSGQELVNRGYTRDVEIAAQLEASHSAPVLDGACFRNATPTPA